MRFIINSIVGFLFGLTPIVGAILMSLIIYDAFPGFISLLLIALLGVSSIWLGIKIFKKVQIMGPINFIAVQHATPELDYPEPKTKVEEKNDKGEAGQ